MRAQLLAILVGLCLNLYAQERCATMHIPANQLRMEKPEQFERWLREYRNSRASSTLRTGEEEILKIPVVFHIVHTGTAIGQAGNIPDSSIHRQIEILNADFRRMNADTSLTPAVFQPFAVDTRIEFVLAKRDPEGLPTTGIVRVRGSKDAYNPLNPADDRLLRSESFWPPEMYVNIHVADLSGGHLGYAQFPFSNLPGLATELENYRLTDGIGLDYLWVGYNDDTNDFNSRGRTATHEIGHYLGLKHIWGEGGCSSDDYCDDTPMQRSSSLGRGVPCTFPGTNSCTDEEDDLPDMFQNFMDYTDDECMNLFTQCQKNRMRQVLTMSPRRQSLLTSPALQDPVQVANDLGIRSVIQPGAGTCLPIVTPAVQVRNYGINLITSLTVSLYRDATFVESIPVSGIALNPLDTWEVTFSSLTLDPASAHQLEFRVETVNGNTDGNSENNVKVVDLPIAENVVLPYFEDFETSPTLSRLTDSGGESLWQLAFAPDATASNSAMLAPYFEQSANFGVLDFLLTKTLDLSSVTSATLSFRYAYANPTAQNLDGLIVAVSTNCGKDFSIDNYLFERYGPALSTTAASNVSFIPSSPADWLTVNLNLTNHTGFEEVQIAFIAVNGSGNNIYLDEISVTSANLAAHDLGLRNVQNLPPVTCETSLTPTVEIRNYGYVRIRSFDLIACVNGTESITSYNGLNILSGYSQTFSVNLSDLQPDENNICFEVRNLNGQQDEQPANNRYEALVMVNEATEFIPVRENFSRWGNSLWLITGDGGEVMDTALIGKNVVVKAAGFSSETVGTRHYLVSPILETGQYREAALQFEYAYARRGQFNDNLRILLSVNCGRTYGTELLNLNAEQLATAQSAGDWIPTDEDWRTIFIDLSPYLSWPDMRIAFVFTNANGNNLYLDNLEVLTTSNPDLPSFPTWMEVYPNPAQTSFQVAFNLTQKQTVTIRVADISGRVVFEQDFPNTVNQTYTMHAPAQAGYYVVQVIGNGFVQSRRLLISR